MSAHAQVLLNDNFDAYNTGTLVGQGGWTQISTGFQPIQVVAQPGGGNAASLLNNGQDAYESLTTNGVPGGTATTDPHVDGKGIESSFTLNVSAVQAGGDYFFHLSDPLGTASAFYERLLAKSTSGGYLLGLESTSGGAAAGFTFGVTALPLNTNEAVDIVWNFVPGATDDTFDVKVNGSSYISQVPWLSTTAEPPEIAAANLRQGSPTAAPTETLDDLLVQSTPEPALAGIWVMSTLTLLRRHRNARSDTF